MELNELNDADPNEIRIMIEEGKFNHLDQIGWLDLCNLLMKKYEIIENHGLYRLIQKETLVHSSEIRNDKHKLIPIRDIEFDFEAGVLNYFSSKVSSTKNPLLKAKFADIVWQEAEEKNIEYASIATEGYLETVDFFLGKEKYNYLTKILVHSIFLSIASGNQDILEKCVKKLEETIRKLVKINKIRCIYDLIKVIIENYEKVKDLIDKDKLLHAIRKGKEYYENRDYVWKTRFEEFERKIL